MIYVEKAFLAYRSNQYLRHATEGHLRSRHKAICANSWTALPPGVPQLHADPKTALFWSQKLTETRTKQFYRLRRSGIYRGTANDFVPFDEASLLRDSELEPRAFKAAQRLNLPPVPFLVRFADSAHVQDAMTLGRFRIAPAAEYKDDPSLNEAQRDDELMHASIRGDRRIVAVLHGYLPGEDPSQSRPLPTQWKELFQYMQSANFFVMCMTDQFDARMFRDFRKNAAIIIRDAGEFLKRIEAWSRRNAPMLEMKSDRVQYYDPYTVNHENLIPGFAKHFNFTYQSEFRATWWPRDKSAPLKPFFIEIGDMSDIAEAIFL